MNKNKIVFVINEFSFFRSHRYSLITKLSKHYNIKIITDLVGSKAESLQIQSVNNIEFTHLAKRKSSINPIKFLMFGVKLKQAIQSIDPDFVFFVSLENCLFGSIISKSLNSKKNFFLITGMGTFLKADGIKKKVLKILHKFSYQKFLGANHNFIFQNHDDQKEFTNFISSINSSVVEGNGIDGSNFYYHKRFQNERNGKIKFLFASKLQTEKGINEYIQAALKLNDQGVNCSFSIAGKYDPSDKLSISSEEYAFLLEHPVLSYLGDINYLNMPETLMMHDIFVLPSFREGLPSAAIEAAATGMPLILTDVPGCKSLINSSKNGFLVKPNCSKSIVNAMQKIIKNKNELLKFGHNSRKMVEERFLIEKITSQYLKLLN